MQKSRDYRFVVALALVVTLALYLQRESFEPADRKSHGDRRSHYFYEVQYEWNEGLTRLVITERDSGVPESNPARVHAVRERVAEILASFLEGLELQRARGRLLVRLLGIEEPYLVDIWQFEYPIDPDSTPLLQAAERGDLKKILAEISKGANPNANDQRGATALMHAADNGNQSMIEALLEAGANPNKRARKVLPHSTSPSEGGTRTVCEH